MEGAGQIIAYTHWFFAFHILPLRFAMFCLLYLTDVLCGFTKPSDSLWVIDREARQDGLNLNPVQ